MEGVAADEARWVLESNAHQAQDDVDNLQDGKGLDCTVERLCAKVPEELGPEETFKGRRQLIYNLSADVNSGKHDAEGLTECGGQDDQASKMILYQLAHAGSGRAKEHKSLQVLSWFGGAQGRITRNRRIYSRPVCAGVCLAASLCACRRALAYSCERP